MLSCDSSSSGPQGQLSTKQLHTDGCLKDFTSINCDDCWITVNKDMYEIEILHRTNKKHL